MTRTVRQGYWIGSAFLLFGLTELAGFPGGSGLVKLERLVTAILLATLGALCLVSSTALRRRQGRAADSTTGQHKTPRL
jgi:drug/metabolite transporter (DMT)-like permease